MLLNVNVKDSDVMRDGYDKYVCWKKLLVWLTEIVYNEEGSSVYDEVDNNAFIRQLELTALNLLELQKAYGLMYHKKLYNDLVESSNARAQKICENDRLISFEHEDEQEFEQVEEYHKIRTFMDSDKRTKKVNRIVQTLTNMFNSHREND